MDRDALLRSEPACRDESSGQSPYARDEKFVGMDAIVTGVRTSETRAYPVWVGPFQSLEDGRRVPYQLIEWSDKSLRITDPRTGKSYSTLDKDNWPDEIWDVEAQYRKQRSAHTPPSSAENRM